MGRPGGAGHVQGGDGEDQSSALAVVVGLACFFVFYEGVKGMEASAGAVGGAYRRCKDLMAARGC